MRWLRTIKSTNFVFRLLVCGGRKFSDIEYMREELGDWADWYPGLHVIEGDATGADRIAQEVAGELRVPCTAYPADWSVGNHAGILRNTRMLKVGKPHAVMAMPGGKGTQNMILQAHEAGLPVYTGGPTAEWEGPEDWDEPENVKSMQEYTSFLQSMQKNITHSTQIKEEILKGLGMSTAAAYQELKEFAILPYTPTPDMFSPVKGDK